MTLALVKHAIIVARRFVPASFAWFRPPMYAPGLGFLMFAVGVNLKVEAFKEVLKKPQVSITDKNGLSREPQVILTADLSHCGMQLQVMTDFLGVSACSTLLWVLLGSG